MPLYRVEVPLYAVIAPTARYLAITTLGTFHERRGDQACFASPECCPPPGCAASASIADLAWQRRRRAGHRRRPLRLPGRAGYARPGFRRRARRPDRALRRPRRHRRRRDRPGARLERRRTGSLDTNGTSLGGYWTHVGPRAGISTACSWDLVRRRGPASTGERIDIDGSALTASIEAGYPVALTGRWTIEPQAQLVWSDVSLDDQRDSISTVDFDSDGAATGRLGFRLLGDYPQPRPHPCPLLQADLWHGFGGRGHRHLRTDSDRHRPRRHLDRGRRRPRRRARRPGEPLRLRRLCGRPRRRDEPGARRQHRPRHQVLAGRSDALRRRDAAVNPSITTVRYISIPYTSQDSASRKQLLKRNRPGQAMGDSRPRPCCGGSRDAKSGVAEKERRMLNALTLLFLCQLAGEVIVQALGITFPGPVLGMGLLFGRPRPSSATRGWRSTRWPTRSCGACRCSSSRRRSG